MNFVDTQLCLVFRISCTVYKFEMFRRITCNLAKLQNSLPNLLLILIGNQSVKDRILFDIINDHFLDTIVLFCLLIRQSQIFSECCEPHRFVVVDVFQFLRFINLHNAILFADFNYLKFTRIIKIDDASKAFFYEDELIIVIIFRSYLKSFGFFDLGCEVFEIIIKQCQSYYAFFV